jgi:iron complex transport system substrate-binding protein
MRTPKLLAATASVALALALSGCGSSTAEEGSAAGSSDATATSAFPVTIENTYGEVTIEEKPERVAAVAWANHEVPLALGVVPVGMSKATWGDDDADGVLPWVEERLEELDADTPVLFDETEGIDFEAVADTKPDVILAAYSGLTKQEYETLSKIAPVVSFPELAWGTSMWEMIEVNSRALGLADEGKKLTADLRKQLTDAVAARPALEGTSAMFAHFDPNDLSQVGYYTTHDPRVGLLEDAGMASPPVVSESSAKSDEFYLSTSAEENDRLADVDVLVTYGSKKLLDQVQKDPLMSQIPAVKRGSVAVLEDSTPLAAAANPSPLSIGWGIDDYLDTVERAADKVG